MPVLETQYMMRIVLVIGSEGMSLTFGYFKIGFIYLLLITTRNKSNHNIKPLIMIFAYKIFNQFFI